MARTRSIRPGFFTNDALGELQPVVRLLFAGLWTVADRDGRLLDRPKKLKAELLAYDHVNVDGALGQLADRGFIERYVSGDVHCIQILNWRKHQHPHPREDASTLPPPAGYEAGPRRAPEPDPGAPPARLVASSSSSSGTLTSSSRTCPPYPPASEGAAPPPGAIDEETTNGHTNACCLLGQLSGGAQHSANCVLSGVAS